MSNKCHMVYLVFLIIGCSPPRPDPLVIRLIPEDVYRGGITDQYFFIKNQIRFPVN